MAKGLTAAQITDKMIRNASAATQDYKDGINRVTVSPTQKAAAKANKMLAGIQASVNSGAYAAACNKVTLQDWKTAATTTGADRYAQGMTDKRQKILNSQTALKAYRDQVTAEVNAMPNDTPQQRDAKAAAMIQGMRKYKQANQ